MVARDHPRSRSGGRPRGGVQYVMVFALIAMLATSMNVLLVLNQMRSSNGGLVSEGRALIARNWIVEMEGLVAHLQSFRREMGSARTASRVGRGEVEESAYRFVPVELSRTDWLLWVRIQKTGSLTLLRVLQNQFNGSVWGPNHECGREDFCPRQCLAFVEDIVRHKHSWPPNKKGHGTCQILVRAHANRYDYEQGLQRGRPGARPVFMTVLREPVQRVISEFVHITRNLAVEVGEKYGRAWDYTYTGRADAIEDFLACEACRTGASNRQTRMLAGLNTTGIVDPSISDETLLAHALRNLERMAFIGITERFEDSMLLLKRTFPEPLRQFDAYNISAHNYDGLSSKLKISEASMQRLRELNRLDMIVYERARDLFEARWRGMMRQETSPVRFIPRERLKSGQREYILAPVAPS